jgi:hypothetical protein
VLLNQTSLTGVLQLGRRETLLVRIGVVLKKWSVSGWLSFLQTSDCWWNTRAWCLLSSETDKDTSTGGGASLGVEATDPC